MKKVFKKMFAVLLSLAVAVGCLFSVAACGGPDNLGGQKVEEGKTQLYVRYRNYGFGDRWLIDVKNRFEAFYADYSFEEGKKGIQVILDPTIQNMVDEIAVARDYVYLSEDFNTLNWYQYSEDITEMASVSLGESYGKDANGAALPGLPGETKSIKDKMNDDEKNYFVLNENGNEKIIAIPFIDTYNGTLSYNADIFEKYSLYYNSNNTIGAKKAEGNLGLGPDGVAGTYDDGLPRTIDELAALCDKMKVYGIVPFAWAGNYTYYVAEFINSLVFTSFGLDTTRELLQGSGTLKNYINGVLNGESYSLSESDLSNGNYKITEKTFNESSFNDAFNTTAVYKAVEFAKKIIQNSYYKGLDNFSPSYAHTDAQADFFWGADRDKNYGFLIDGTWWYNEAEPYISQYETVMQKSRNTKNIQYMPLPKADIATWEALKGENFTPSTFFSGIVIKKNLDKVQKLISELFVRFFCSDESLVAYTKIVSTPRALTYAMSEEDYNQLSPYGKSLYSVHAKDAAHGYSTSVVQYLRSSSGLGYSNPGYFVHNYFLIGKKYSSNIIDTFYNNPNYSSYQFFIDLLKKGQDN